MERSLREVEDMARAEAPGSQNRLAASIVLLVEDEDFVRVVTREVLLVAGYRVLAAGNVEEALDLFAHSESPISLLLTDHKLPGGDGANLVEQMRAAQPSLKAIVISGYPRNQIASGHLAPTEVSYLAKPFSTDTLLKAVGDALRIPEIPPLAKTAVAS